MGRGGGASPVRASDLGRDGANDAGWRGGGTALDGEAGLDGGGQSGRAVDSTGKDSVEVATDFTFFSSGAFLWRWVEL